MDYYMVRIKDSVPPKWTVVPAGTLVEVKGKKVPVERTNAPLASST